MMRVSRFFTKEESSPYENFSFRAASSEIRNPDGGIVFQAENIEFPDHWSQVACDVLAQKYLRKAGVPVALRPVAEDGVPSWLCRHEPDSERLAALPEKDRSGGETNACQVFDRMAGTWTYWGWKAGYFDSEADARAYYDEMRYMLCAQVGAPNSPQWFNTGLHWAYGIDGPSQGHHYVDFKTGELVRSASAYEHPQPPCLLHSEHHRRSRQRGRHHGPLGPRGAALQVWFWNRNELFGVARRGRAAVGRWTVVGPPEFPQDRRPGGRRHQVGRDDAARCQDGGRRHRSPGHRELHRVEGPRGAEGGRPGRRLAQRSALSRRGHGGLPRRRRRRG